MKKIIVRIAVLSAIFIATFAFVFRTIDYKTSSSTEVSAKSQGAALPVVSFSVSGNEINQTEGYTVLWDDNCPRESITPVSTAKEFSVLIKEKGKNVKKVSVDVMTIPSLDVIENIDIPSLTTTEDGRLSADISVSADMTPGEEYLCRVTLMDDEGGYIYYYTRLQVTTFGNLTKNIEYVTNFHNCTFSKDDVSSLEEPMETDDSLTVTDYSDIDITADLNSLSFGDLGVSEIYRIVPTISEYNDTYVSIGLSFWVRSTVGNYNVIKCHENYRLNYTESKIYLLDYERTMDEIFDGSALRVDDGYLDLGISSEKDSLNMLKSEDGKILLFSYQGTLWELNTETNEMHKLLSYSDGSDYDRNEYIRYDFTLLSVDNGGDAQFAVYGKIGRGDYEGRCGVIYYSYSAETNRIQEMMFIPVNLDYKELDGAFGKVSYTSEFGVFYFTLFDSYYSYELKTHVLHTEVEDLGENWVYFPDSMTLVYNESPDLSVNKRIVFLDVKTQEKKYISDDAGRLLDLQGTIDGRIVYGTTDASLISRFDDGSELIPYTYLAIMDASQKLETDYNPPEGTYVGDVTLDQSLIHLDLYASAGKTADAGYPVYHYSASDVIIDIHPVSEAVPLYTTEYDTTRRKLMYVKMPSGYTPEAAPSVYDAEIAVVNADTSALISHEKTEHYYVYAYGNMVFTSENLGEAIDYAAACVGTVTDYEGCVAWTCGITAKEYTMSSFKIGDYTFDTDAKTLYEWVAEKSGMKTAAIKVGNIEEVQYFINRGRPVCVTYNGGYVVAYGYEVSYIVFRDPATGNRSQMKKSDFMSTYKGECYVCW